ncbi:hypothetical protein U879_01645 [Defluviimonas sp. 20V17]|uniref:Uncharacterized protein n=1 Tax=Allgaiera indica TaxID=765699 RepID=A0AAN4UT71_9RHOB|nr:hypothetical protein [Allgaiera indica]KDB05398.1 hypothetical protein U879_01645 [Defluviimonas sp. 20V17]GHE04118.1 hypothetical protein GCM10008024_29940 [Allgaiera indica]SDX49575.1 hypothetical protein SAMN05444006_11816 [Allgaiera indica]
MSASSGDPSDPGAILIVGNSLLDQRIMARVIRCCAASVPLVVADSLDAPSPFMSAKARLAGITVVQKSEFVPARIEALLSA